MTYIICEDVAPAPVSSLLFDLYNNDHELALFIEAITENVDMTDFGQSSTDQSSSVCACEAIAIIVQSRTIPSETRVEFLQTECPQDDFQPEDFESWDGVLLAMQFASTELLDKIARRIPIELISGAIAVLSPDTQRYAKALFYQ